MERFTYWATLLALPMVGLLVSELVDRFRMRAIIPLAIAAALPADLPVAWVTIRPAEGAGIKVDSVADWLNRDRHDQYRYVTLGFGDKISRLAVLTDAGSVDGEWNSGRRLPELTANGAGSAQQPPNTLVRPAMDALRAMLRHADKYGLKWVIVRDPYYDPLLKFAGWRPVDDLENHTITVWGKDGVPPAVPLNAPEMPPRWQGILWGTLPFGSSILAILVAPNPGTEI